MIINQPSDNEINSILDFTYQELQNAHPHDIKFSRFWFYRAGQWTIRVIKDPDNDIVAGIVFYIQAPARLFDNHTDIYWISTLYVKEEYRSSGAGAKLLLNAYKTLPLLGSMCGNELSIPLSNLLGKTISEEKIRRYIYLLSETSLDFAPANTRKILHQVLIHQTSLQNGSLSTTWVTQFPPKHEYEKLWQEFSAKLNCCVERNIDYIAHRYLDAPYVKYHIIEMRDYMQLVGICVVRFQDTPYGLVARVVDFIAQPLYAQFVWHELLVACKSKNAVFVDFFVLGTFQHNNILAAGWQQANDINHLDELPNLLSPIDYRRWSYSFHIGGFLLKNLNALPKPDEVWFTKGDGDRDWPTVQLIQESML